MASPQTKNNPSKNIGQSKPRVDTREKATGHAIFTDDIQFGAGLLHARVKRSPHAHAIIKKIDTSNAAALPGVKAIVTGSNFPNRTGLYLKDRFIFSRDRVRYVGEPVAGVAAISEEIAEKAVQLINVDYEILPGVFDPVFGASAEAPLLHPELESYDCPDFIYPVASSNIANHFKVRKGNVENIWEDCAAIVEQSFYIPHIQHVPIEPHVAVARVDDDGSITLWASSQSPFAQRSVIAKSLQMPESKIRVIAPFIGGGFGCKAGVTMETIPVALALKTKGRPVKFRLTREEEFFTNFVRQALSSRVKIGCDKDGILLGLQHTMYWDGGGYTDYGVNITRAGGYSGSGPFRCENIKIDSYCVYTNHPVGGAYRGFGMSEVHTGIIQAMDILSEKIGMDKVEFLKRNLIQEADITLTGMQMHKTGIMECLEKAAKAVNLEKKELPTSPGKLRGKGIAVMWKAPAMPPNAGSSAMVKLNEDASVLVLIGGQEIGQGSFTAMAQITAEALGVPFESVIVKGPIDTQFSPYEWQTVASRLTWSMGNAVRNAALDARKRILDMVAEAWGENPDNLDINDGMVFSYKTEETISLKNIVVHGIPKPNDQGWTGGPIVGSGSFMPTYVTSLDKETGQGNRAVVHYTTGAQAIDLEIDKETGQITILKVVSAFDVGKAINPDLVISQIEGGFVQGMSSALFEEMKFVDGHMQNPNFVDYRIATSMDIPNEIDSIIVEAAQDDGPFGARGIGEHPMVPAIPAIANAIFDATGVRVSNPPFTAEKIYLAMLDAGIIQ